MILHRIRVWKGKKTRNKGKQACLWDFLTIPGTCHLQVVLFPRRILSPGLLDNSLKLKISYLELMQSWPLSPGALTLLITTNGHHTVPLWTSKQTHNSIALLPSSLTLLSTQWALHKHFLMGQVLTPPLWHLTNDQPAIFDTNSSAGSFSLLNSFTDAAIHLDSLVRLCALFLLLALKDCTINTLTAPGREKWMKLRWAILLGYIKSLVTWMSPKTWSHSGIANTQWCNQDEYSTCYNLLNANICQAQS